MFARGRKLKGSTCAVHALNSGEARRMNHIYFAVSAPLDKQLSPAFSVACGAVSPPTLLLPFQRESSSGSLCGPALSASSPSLSSFTPLHLLFGLGDARRQECHPLENFPDFTQIEGVVRSRGRRQKLSRDSTEDVDGGEHQRLHQILRKRRNGSPQARRGE